MAPQGPGPCLSPVLEESCRDLRSVTRSVDAVLIPRLSALLHQPLLPTSSIFSLFVQILFYAGSKTEPNREDSRMWVTFLTVDSVFILI